MRVYSTAATIIWIGSTRSGSDCPCVRNWIGSSGIQPHDIVGDVRIIHRAKHHDPASIPGNQVVINDDFSRSGKTTPGTSEAIGPSGKFLIA